MGKGILCTCEHNRSDHAEKKLCEDYVTVKTWRGECVWVDCNCLEFKEEANNVQT